MTGGAGSFVDGGGAGRRRPRLLTRLAAVAVGVAAIVAASPSWSGTDGEAAGGTAAASSSATLPLTALAGACRNVPYGDGSVSTEEVRERGEAYFGTTPNGTGPTVVDVGLFIDELTEVSPVDNTFKIEGFLDVVWCDPRRDFVPEEVGADTKIYVEADAQHELNASWHPDLALVNEVDPREVEQQELLRLPDGTTEYREKFAAQLEARYDLTRFPFDRQRLEVEVESFTWPSHKVRLVQRGDMVGFSKEFQIPDWRIMGTDEEVALVQEERDRAKFSEFRLVIDVVRQSSFYLWKILLPLVLMVAVSWSVFWMSGENLSDRVGVAFTGLLTVVAYQFIMSDTLPKVVYFTFWDGVLTLSFVLMAATIAENVLVQAVSRRRGEGVGARIDKTCRWAFPAVYGIGLLSLSGLYLL